MLDWQKDGVVRPAPQTSPILKNRLILGQNYTIHGNFLGFLMEFVHQSSTLSEHSSTSELESHGDNMYKLIFIPFSYNIFVRLLFSYIRSLTRFLTKFLPFRRKWKLLSFVVGSSASIWKYYIEFIQTNNFCFFQSPLENSRGHYRQESISSSRIRILLELPIAHRTHRKVLGGNALCMRAQKKLTVFTRYVLVLCSWHVDLLTDENKVTCN